MNNPTPYQLISSIFSSALSAVNPETAVSNNLSIQSNQLHIGGKVIPLHENGRIFLVSIGKASVPMANAAATLLGDRLTRGIILTKEGAQHANSAENIDLNFGSHPVSSQLSINGTRKIKELLAGTKEEDIVICLISGGASALFTQPVISLSSWQALNSALLKSGCPITEFNTVRRQLDDAKGGGLAQWCTPATSYTLILSDVIGNSLAAIGSGPTYYSNDTPKDIESIFEKYNIYEQLSPEISAEIKTAVSQLEKLNQQDQPFNKIISDINFAAKAAAQAAEKAGYQTQILTTQFEGEASELGKFAASIGKDLAPGHCMILGGESTVSMKGNGFGGRNSEIGLSAAIQIDGIEGLSIASLATDGDDGPTERAGVIVNGEVMENGRSHNLSAEKHLQNNDSGTYFKKFEQQTKIPIFVNTGLTGTNVNDLIIILKEA